MKKVLYLLFISLLLFNVNSFAKKNIVYSNTNAGSDTTTIYLKDYGLFKTRKKNCSPILKKALDQINNDGPKVIVFEKGIYHFYPEGCYSRNYFESNTTDINPRVCAFLFEGDDNLILDGKGSTLIFHEQMQPFTFDNCKNIILKNINIDWEEPLIAQGEVLKVNDEFLDIKINLKESPYVISEGKILFKAGHKKLNPWKGTMEFDRAGRYVVPQTGDRGCLGRGWNGYLAENILPGIIRIYFPFLRKPALGNFLVLRHAERIHSGIFIQESKNITIKNVNLYHATGLGILAQFSEDLTFDEYRAIPNRKTNRYFGGGDDGLQVSNCKGLIRVNNCQFSGLMDDPINVHGTSVKVVKILGNYKLQCKFMHHQSIGMNWGHEGDKISFIENEKMNSIGAGEIKNFEFIDDETFTLILKDAVPPTLEINDALENLTWSPDLQVSNSHFKSCRARGLLVSTPGKVVIENNIFESSGSAILIAGDANGWFESGAVTDVTIRNNNFTELCNSSSYQFCEGIISIFPIIPELNEDTPPFHKNIRIENNEFHPFDYPVLYARSVDGISFENNIITRSKRFEPYHRRKHTFTFESCKNASILNNTFSEEVLGMNVLLVNTNNSELNIGSDQNLNIKSN